jgi:hypothetical protein
MIIEVGDKHTHVEESVSALWRLTERWLHQLPHEYNFGQSAMPVRSEVNTSICHILVEQGNIRTRHFPSIKLTKDRDV